MRRVTKIIGAVALVAVVACSSGEPGAAPGDGSPGPDGAVADATVDSGGPLPVTFPQAPLSTFSDDAQAFTIELRTAPAEPPLVGRGEGELRIADATTHAPVDGLLLTVTSYMPVMRHSCSTVPIKVVPQGQGVYALRPLMTAMAGDCELRISIAGEAGVIKVVSPTFAVTSP